MNPFSMICSLLLLSAPMCLFLGSGSSNAILVQPHNYMLDDSGILGPQSPLDSAAAASSLFSNFLRDQADKDSDSAFNFRSSRANGYADDQMTADNAASNGQADNGEPSLSHFSAEMAELIKSEQQHQRASAGQSGAEEPSLSSSVAHVLMNVAQAAADEAASNQAAAAEEQASAGQSSGSGSASEQQQQASDSSASLLGSSAANSKAGSEQSKLGPLWYNPKETIPVLKISSMATPSKYKKVYFRSEKKLVDGAFHSPSQTEKDESKSFKRAFISTVQRRSSRGTSSSAAPPGILQDGVVEFLRKFRDVYVQTRPNGAVASAAASSPFAALVPFAPASVSSSSALSSRPTLMSALGALSSAASKVNSANALGQAAAAAASAASQSGSASSVGSPSAGAQLAGAASNVVASVVAGPSSGASPSKSPLSAQSYVSFWSKTFPTWVRKMLKQMRRRSLQNHSKRQQSHAHHQSHSTLGQAAQAAANVAHAVEQASSGTGSSASNH